MITDTDRALKYLAYHQNGSLSRLKKKVSNEQLLVLEKFLDVKEDFYKFNEDGLNYYSNNVYVSKEKSHGLLNVISRFKMVFD